jgi:hypothetical protein
MENASDILTLVYECKKNKQPHKTTAYFYPRGSGQSNTKPKSAMRISPSPQDVRIALLWWSPRDGTRTPKIIVLRDYVVLRIAV